MRNDARKSNGTSLAKGPAWFIGLALLALGITGLIFSSTDFAASPVDGDVTGSTWLSIAGNGWTWALFAAAGLLLMLAAPMHWGAKTMALIVGLALGAASVISIVDGSDVFGIFAANGMTMLVWGVAAAALLLIALLPRVGGKKKDTHETDHVQRERVIEREPREPVTRHEDRHAPTVPVERTPVEHTNVERTHVDRTDVDRTPVEHTERTGRFERDTRAETTTDRHVEPTGATSASTRREDVRPEDHNRLR